MSNVTGVRESVWQKDGQDVTTYYVSIEGCPDVPCYDAKAKELETGKPLPDGWQVTTSKAGKEYLKPPGQQRGGRGPYVPKWTDTEVGAKWADARIDRRRALELAVEMQKEQGSVGVVDLAATFYEFLKSQTVEPGSTVTSSPEASGMAARDGAEPDHGEGSGSASTSSGVPNAPAAGAVSEPAPASPEEEQRQAYIKALREGPGLPSAFTMAKALFNTDANKRVRNMRDFHDLSVDELFEVAKAFEERREEIPA